MWDDHFDDNDVNSMFNSFLYAFLRPLYLSFLKMKAYIFIRGNGCVGPATY